MSIFKSTMCILTAGAVLYTTAQAVLVSHAKHEVHVAMAEGRAMMNTAVHVDHVQLFSAMVSRGENEYIVDHDLSESDCERSKTRQHDIYCVAQ